jgi:hypothetical protein
VLYSDLGDKPRAVGVRTGSTTRIFHLFRDGESKDLKTIWTARQQVTDIILNANDRDFEIILSDFHRMIDEFNIPIDDRDYNVYDVHYPTISSSGDRESDENKINKVLDRLEQCKSYPYRKVLSNASIVYKYMEHRGILQNYTLQHPKWSLKTWSGRSKSLDFNVQGWHEDDHIRPVGSDDHDILIHFDWICADIRVASIMSEDKLLNRSFERSDPYDIMRKLINMESEEKITRDECKVYLLKSINSMNLDSVALIEIYRGLGKWIHESKIILEDGGCLTSLLGRRFSRATAKNDLAVLNGIMQGSVAHAMQNVLRQTWLQLPDSIVTEVHDSLVMSCPNQPSVIKSMIKTVVPIMVRPFAGLIDSNPYFPCRVSVGPLWKKWKHIVTYRDGKIEYAKKQAKDSAEQAQETTAPAKEAEEERTEESAE